MRVGRGRDRVEVAVPDHTDPDGPRQHLATLTVERMDGLRVDRVELRLVTSEDHHG